MAKNKIPIFYKVKINFLAENSIPQGDTFILKEDNFIILWDNSILIGYYINTLLYCTSSRLCFTYIHYSVLYSCFCQKISFYLLLLFLSFSSLVSVLHLVSTSMDYDSILLEIGEFGRFQQVTEALLWVPAMFCGVHSLLFSFTGLVTTFKSLHSKTIGRILVLIVRTQMQGLFVVLFDILCTVLCHSL